MLCHYFGPKHKKRKPQLYNKAILVPIIAIDLTPPVQASAN
jgi:hypothetical protein